VRQDIGKDVEAVKNQNRQETHNSAIAVCCHFQSCVLNFTDTGKTRMGLSNICFNSNLEQPRVFHRAKLVIFTGSFEINPAWPFGQREGHHSGRSIWVNRFLKKKFSGPVFFSP
jgi:hypothetical protein